MVRVRLQIQRHGHDSSRQVGHGLMAVRLYADVALPTTSGVARFHRAVVDTGAPLSMFPMRMWKDTLHAPLGRVRVGGIVARDECRIPAVLAELNCTLFDRSGSLGPLRIHAFLAESDAAPALLRMAGLLERVRLVVDVAADKAFVEQP